MTDSLKQRLVDGKLNFQGEIITVRQLIGDDENSAIFNTLIASQVRELFIDILSVGRVEELKTKFYVERDFNKYRADGSNDKRPQKMNFEEISSIANYTKMILLSDKAGTGKTTTFRHTAMELKKMFPNYWISYIDLKRHLQVYEKFEQIFQPIEILKEILSITDKFEAEIFSKLFNYNKVILLYDGVDEIAPNFKDFFIKFIANVRNSTKNQQWIATRPQHTKELMTIFNQTVYKFMPYNDDQNLKFIQNVLKDLNAQDIDAREILSLTQHNADGPLMLQIMTELYAKDKTIFDYNSKFSFYDKMIDMKKKIVNDKGEIVNNDRDNKKADMTIWRVHQIYALKLMFDEDVFANYFGENCTIDINEFQLLKRWKTEKSNWTPEVISRYGLLIVDNWNTSQEFPDFIHRTFAEFFVVQFILQDLYDLDEDDNGVISETEVELRVSLLIKYSNERKSPIHDFILSFINSQKAKKMHNNFTSLVTSNEMQNLLFNLRENIQYLNLVEILSIDVRFLSEFRFNDNKTIFQNHLNSGSLSNFEHVVRIYNRSLGEHWIHQTGYSIKKNISSPSDEEIEKALTQNLTLSHHNKSKMNTLFTLLHLVNQEKLPQNDILNFFNTNIYLLLEYSFHSSVLVQKSMKTIEIYFNDCKAELLKTIHKMKMGDRISLSSDEYDTNSFELLKKLEEFLRSDETIKVDDIRASILNLYAIFTGMKGVIKSYGEGKFTKSEIEKLVFIF